MLTINRADLDILPNRQRKDVPKSHVAQLKASILDHVLLHAPVVQPTANGRYILVAGECRTHAIDQIAADGKSFTYNLTEFAPGRMPVVLIDEAISELGRGELELVENTDRAELPWQDRMQALAFLHNLRVAENPNHSISATARELVETQNANATVTGAPATAEVTARKAVTRATIIAQHLSDPAIAKARNATEAFNLIVSKESRAFEAELIKRGKKRVTTIEVRHGSLLEILPKLDPGQFDLICGDPPYGIEVNSAGFRSRTVHHHNYTDSPDEVRTLLTCILSEGFRITKPRANLLLFCDIDFFGWLKDASARAGWDPFRTPITWQKSDSEGMAPWGREGFRRTTEWVFFARKGQRGLIHSPIDVLRHNRVARDDREYGAEKPVPLLRELLAAASLPGDYVLDPCCGSGSTLVAARELNMRALGIEKDQTAFNLSLVKSQEPLVPKGLDAL